MATSIIRILFVLIFLGLTSCGGGGSGGTANNSMATVGVLLHDATTQQWDEAIATVTSVSLIGDNGQVDLFTGSETVDLLKLGDFSELFAVSDQVPPGSYSKIRLQLSDLVLNRLDPVTGDVTETATPRLVGNGKIDLNPRDSFVVAPGAVIFVELDVDMEKSLKITQTGNGTLIVRPVVFVDIRTDQASNRLSRVHGVITSTDTATGSFSLCQTDLASDSGDDDEQDSALRDENHCVTVTTDSATGIFGGDGLPENFTDLAVDEEATVVGRLRRLDNSDPAADGDLFALDALTIEEGPLGTFLRVHGTAASGVDAVTDQFGFDIAAGQDLGGATSLPVQLFEHSRIFTPEGDEKTRDDIVSGAEALVDAVLQVGPPDVLNSPLVILGVGEPAGEAALEGTIASIDTAAGSLIVTTEESGDRCVNAASADIFLVTDDDDSTSSTAITLADLLAGQEVEVFGSEGTDGCVVADKILAESGD